MIFEPHTYQSRAIELLTEQPALLLAAFMGAGKTVMTLTAINIRLYQHFNADKVLISAPKTVAEETWASEAAKWDHLGHLRIVKVLGAADERLAALQKDADIYVINHENFPWLVKQYGKKRWPFSSVVFDETLGLKDRGSLRFKSMRYVRDQIDWLVLLSGTPTPNGLEALWSQVFLLDGGERLYRTITAFREQWFEPDKVNRRTGQVYSWKLKPGADAEIFARIADICVSIDEGENRGDRPLREDIVVPVPLPDSAREAYRELSCELVLFDSVTAPAAATLCNKLRQIASGSIYEDADDSGRRGAAIPIHTGKVEALKRIIAQHPGEQILVFVDFQFSRDALAALGATGLDKAGWDAKRVPLMALHPASCGYGLNLQHGGHIVVWYDMPWNLDWYLQGMTRIDRQGQSQQVKAYHLVAQNTVEDLAVAPGLIRKGATQRQLLDAIKGSVEQQGRR